MEESTRHLLLIINTISANVISDLIRKKLYSLWIEYHFKWQKAQKAYSVPNLTPRSATKFR